VGCHEDQLLRQVRKNRASVLISSRRTVEKDSAGNTQAILVINREVSPQNLLPTP